MPTPVGHVLGGLALYLATKKAEPRHHIALAATCLGVALVPDLDFAIGPLAGRNYHHYFTHSLGFGLLFSLAWYAAARAIGSARALWYAGVASVSYLSHIGLDLLARDTSPPFGVQLLWPFSEAFYISPILLFDDVWRGSLGKLFGLHNWIAVAREVSILGALAALLGWWRSRRA